MSHRSIDEFRTERSELTELTLEKANLEIKRFFSLDSQTYREGALPVQTKELLGLVASMVLRCDDCIFYHLDRCHEEGVSTEELQDAMSIALVVGVIVGLVSLASSAVRWCRNRNKEQGPTRGGRR